MLQIASREHVRRKSPSPAHRTRIKCCCSFHDDFRNRVSHPIRLQQGSTRWVVRRRSLFESMLNLTWSSSGLLPGNCRTSADTTHRDPQRGLRPSQQHCSSIIAVDCTL